MVTIGVRYSQSAQVKELTERFPEVWGTVGVHPLHCHEEPLPSVEALAAEAAHPRIIGIGESGLDYFYDKAPREAQASESAFLSASTTRMSSSKLRPVDLG